MAITEYDIIVVGGGHAGIEASLAAARLGGRVLLVTHSRSEIGRMPCNPAIGGLGKGHLVREIDVLGGEMGRAIDAAGIQFRILNRRKGPAVQSPRAQADKSDYQQYMQQTVLDEPGLEVAEDEVVGLNVANGDRGRTCVVGVRARSGREISSARVILCAGTFLRGLMHVGEKQQRGGREGAASAEGLSGDLTVRGFTLRRLKTGTPPRLRRSSVDFSTLEPQSGDADPQPFSFRTEDFFPEQVLCHLTHTNRRTHDLIRDRLHLSPLYAGIIAGQGPRYCPSVEDKVVRFPERDRHLIFLEPEGRQSDEIYVNGLSTSLPAEVQTEMVRSIRGLERAELTRFGYAVEYDSLPSYQLRRTLESKLVDGLYLAGQIIGTSGYEEAAAQGIVAGINCILSLKNQDTFIIDRSEAYLGVLVDDLVTKDISEPYRMFTSRAEHRLALRCDNAASRLLPLAERIGLLSDRDLARMQAREAAVAATHRLLRTFVVTDPESGERLKAAELFKRPGTGLGRAMESGQEGAELARAVARELAVAGGDLLGACLTREVLKQVEADIKYEGYITKQKRLLRQQEHLDHLELPVDLDYRGLAALSFEAREKLDRMRPANLGQASRIDGVRAGDLAVLTVILRRLEGRNRA